MKYLISILLIILVAYGLYGLQPYICDLWTYFFKITGIIEPYIEQIYFICSSVFIAQLIGGIIVLKNATLPLLICNIVINTVVNLIFLLIDGLAIPMFLYIIYLFITSAFRTNEDNILLTAMCERNLEIYSNNRQKIQKIHQLINSFQ